MLKTLFSSSIRAELLALLLNRSDEKFYIREIAKILKKNPSGVKRELDKLEEMEIVLSERIANLRYFRSNRNSPFFTELKDLISKSIGLSGNLKDLLRANGIKTAFIHGPYANGDDAPNVDVIAVGPVSPALTHGLQELEKKFCKKIQCSFIEEPDYRLRKKKDPELKLILSGKRIPLLGRA